jgi:MYXO-CTERM domain-containing protein
VPPKIKRTLAWVAGALGLVFLVAGSFLSFIRMLDLSPADANVALANLADVELDRVPATDSLVISLIIPDTPQWARIRRRWGEPDFLVAAVSPNNSCYCLPKLPLTIKVADDAEQIPRQLAGPPYGHSSDCSASTLKFNAAPGTKLTVSVIKNGTEPLPPGDLIIVGSWWNTKDKLVGISLDQWFKRLSTTAIVGGLGLILLAALFTWRRRA